MRFIVTARSFRRDTGEPTALRSRDEVIDTATNILFAGLTSAHDVRTNYEMFWNNVNHDSEEVVWVSDARPA